MGMGSHHCADLPVQMQGQGFLLFWKLGVEIYYDYPGFLSDLTNQTVSHLEGAADTVHIDPPLEVHNCDGNLFLGNHGQSTAGHTGGVVLRSENAVVSLQEVDNFLALPDVISGSDYVDSGLEQTFGGIGGDSQPFGGVFTIGNNKIRPGFFTESRQTGKYGPKPRLADDITDYQDLDCVNGYSLFLA
jgi:hypothetical protein